MEPRYEALAREHMARGNYQQSPATKRFLKAYDALQERGIIMFPGNGMTLDESASFAENRLAQLTTA